MRITALIPLIMVVVALLLISTSAQANYEIKYRVVGELKPGNEVYFHLMMAKISRDGDMKPVMDALFTVVINGRERVELRANEEGIIVVPVKIPSFSLLGSTITLEVMARSDMYGVETSRTINEYVRPDIFALSSIMLAVLSILIPLLAIIRRAGS